MGLIKPMLEKSLETSYDFDIDEKNFNKDRKISYD